MDPLNWLYIVFIAAGTMLTTYFSVRRIRTNDIRHLETSLEKLRLEFNNRFDRLDDKLAAHVKDYHLK